MTEWHIFTGSYSSVDVFTAQELLRKKVALCHALMAEAGCSYLMVPTVMHHYLVPELQAQEDDANVKFNAHLGKFTNFVNLLGLAAVSVPASILPPVNEQVCRIQFVPSDSRWCLTRRTPCCCRLDSVFPIMTPVPATAFQSVNQKPAVISPCPIHCMFG